jgi:penicillin-binding protein 2
MSEVVNAPSGTAIYSKINGIEMCGKTGTVQNPHGADHSVFVAFAPRDNPKIAIAVVVENAGFGSTWSAPIASLMVEKYLTRSISRPKAYVDRLLEANLLPGGAQKPKPEAKPAIKQKTDSSKTDKPKVNPITKTKIQATAE